MFGDCMSWLPALPSGMADLALVDTNWGINEGVKASDGRNTPIKQRSGKLLLAPQNTYDVQLWDAAQPEQSYFDELFRVANKAIIMGENYLQFSQKASSTGRIVWDKVRGDSDFSDCEIFWTNLHNNVKIITYMWNGMFQGKSLAEPRVQQPNKKLNEKRQQPAHKPVLLYRALYERYTKPGQVVIDTHVGSGSSRIAAWDYGLDFYGFENNRKNYIRQQRRFENHAAAAQLYRGY